MIQNYELQVGVESHGNHHNPFGVFNLPRLHQLHRQRAPQWCKVGEPVDGKPIDGSGGKWFCAAAPSFCQIGMKSDLLRVWPS